MRETGRVALIATFTALVVGSNLALWGLPDVKLDAAVVFLTTLLFGVVAGASVALLSELIWSQVSPWGGSGAYLLPFLLSAELLYVLAGWAARRILKGDWESFPTNGILFGGMLCVFTFLWDVWANFGSALLTSNLSLGAVLVYEFNPFAIAFDVTHELSNLILGLSLVPATLVLIPKVMKGMITDGVE